MYSKVGVNGPNRTLCTKASLAKRSFERKRQMELRKDFDRKDGKPIERFGSMTSPSSRKLIKAIESAL